MLQKPNRRGADIDLSFSAVSLRLLCASAVKCAYVMFNVLTTGSGASS